MTPSPEILHCHDWTAALVPVLVRDQGLPFATVLSIHHLAEQGNFDSWDFALTNLPGRYFEPAGEFFGRLNLLKGGILFADRIVVSSEPYAHQIQTPSLGEGLEIVLREQPTASPDLGGADYRRWNPATDNSFPLATARNLDLKAASRDALLDTRLAPAPRGPVFGMVTRLVGAKGFDILMPVLDRLLADDVRLVILGKGDPAYETALAIAARKYPDRLAYQHDYDEALAHLIEGGSDIALIPSRVEPGAFSAMHSLNTACSRSRARPAGSSKSSSITIPRTPATASSFTNTGASRSGTRSSARRKSSPIARMGAPNETRHRARFLLGAGGGKLRRALRPADDSGCRSINARRFSTAEDTEFTGESISGR